MCHSLSMHHSLRTPECSTVASQTWCHSLLRIIIGCGTAGHQMCHSLRILIDCGTVDSQTCLVENIDGGSIKTVVPWASLMLFAALLWCYARSIALSTRALLMFASWWKQAQSTYIRNHLTHRRYAEEVWLTKTVSLFLDFVNQCWVDSDEFIHGK